VVDTSSLRFVKYIYNYQYTLLGKDEKELERYLNEHILGDEWKKTTESFLGDALNNKKLEKSKIPIPGQKNGDFNYRNFLNSLIDFTGLVTKNVIAIYPKEGKRYVTVIPESSLEITHRYSAITKKLKELKILGNSSNGLVKVYNARHSSPDGKLFVVDIDENGAVRSGIPVKKYHPLFLESGFLDRDEFYTAK